MTLEVYFNANGDRAYVTSADPGHLDAFNITDPRAPRTPEAEDFHSH